MTLGEARLFYRHVAGNLDRMEERTSAQVAIKVAFIMAQVYARADLGLREVIFARWDTSRVVHHDTRGPGPSGSNQGGQGGQGHRQGQRHRQG
jgi:hypothetical protein